jgi:hypothetical protein
VLKATNTTMRLFFTAALIGGGAFHPAFGQNTCETFSDSVRFSNSGMATGPTPTLETFTASGTMTFTNTYTTSNQGNGLGPCANGNPPIFQQFATGQSNSKGFCNPAFWRGPVLGSASPRMPSGIY